MKQHRRCSRFSAILLAAACGCEASESIHPLATEVPDVRADGGVQHDAPIGSASSMPVGPPKRTIETRNPFGGPIDNLFVDGDFELSTTFAFDAAGQYGWRAFSMPGAGSGLHATQSHVLTETGGQCHSGLRCAVLEYQKGYYVEGAAAPNAQAHEASLWARVPDGRDCTDVRAVLIDCSTFLTKKKLTSDEVPGEGGWCEFGAQMPQRDSAVCMYIESSVKKGEVGLLDSAVLRPASKTKQLGEVWVPSADIFERLQSVRDLVRKRRW